MNKRQKKKKQKKENVIQEKKKKGKTKILGIISVVATISAILSVIFQVFDIKFPIRHKPDVDILEEPIGVKYLKSVRDSSEEVYPLFEDVPIDVEYLKNVRDSSEEVYPLFKDTIDSGGKNIFNDNCATQVLISNNYDEEIVLTKIIFEAEDIVVDTKPVLHIDKGVYSNEENIELDVWNSGWGDGENVIFSFEDANGENIDDYLIPERQKIEVPIIKYGDLTRFQIWNKEDFLKDGEYQIKVKCTQGDEDIDVNYLYGVDRLYINVSNGEFLNADGLGGPSMRIYGIKIDTSEETYKNEEAISEAIGANSRMEFPICFAADKSCTFKFRIGFEVRKKNNDSEICWTDNARLEFSVSSIDVETESSENVENYSREELMEIINQEYPGCVKVTYPYVEKDTLKYVEPYFE